MNITKRIKSITPRNIYDGLITVLRDHTPVLIAGIAAILVGYALYSVTSLTSSTSDQIGQAENGEIDQTLTGIVIDPELERTLQAISEDIDVIIPSNIASYRRSAFSDITNESTWVINVAKILEQYYADNNSYPAKQDIAAVIENYTSQQAKQPQTFNIPLSGIENAIERGLESELPQPWKELTSTEVGVDSNQNGIIDSYRYRFEYSPAEPQDIFDAENRAINDDEGFYSYDTSLCSPSGGCQEYTLSDTSVAGGAYQLSSRDVVLRQWVNDISQLLSAYQFAGSTTSIDEAPLLLYPSVDTFTSDLTAFYQESMTTDIDEKEFQYQLSLSDPQGFEVNSEDGRYSYRGVNCNAFGCEDFILRASFKDGAQYFQQSN